MPVRLATAGPRCEEVFENERAQVRIHVLTESPLAGQCSAKRLCPLSSLAAAMPQPFRGWGHTWPGHFLPTDRVGHWSTCSGGPGGKLSMSFRAVAPRLREVSGGRGTCSCRRCALPCSSKPAETPFHHLHRPLCIAKTPAMINRLMGEG